MSEPIVYLNGQMLPASRARLPIYDAGVVMGATVSEMTRTFNGKLFRIDDHLARLFRSLRYVRFDIGLSTSQLADISAEIIAHNRGLLPAGGELGLIHFVTAGENSMYAGGTASTTRSGPTVCVHTFPLPFARWAEKMRRGVHLVTPSIRHVPPQCYDPKMKYRSRMHYYLADQEARLVDPDAMALLLDLSGNVTETSSANFLMVERGAIVSPPLENILPGVSRQIVIELAAELRIPLIERNIQAFGAINADEALVSSTPYCLLPVTRINGIAIADGAPGPVFRRLLTAWSKLVAVDIEEQICRAPSGTSFC